MLKKTRSRLSTRSHTLSWCGTVLLAGCAHAQTAPKVPATPLPINEPMASADADAFYARQIVLPADAGKDLKSAVADAALVLGKMTGAEFQTGPEAKTAGVLLLRPDSPLAPADASAKLKDKGREPFLLRSDGKNTLLVVANGDAGLTHGLYYYLEKLGARWLAPGENWEVIPRRRNIALKLDELVIPAYKLRSFFGTGGFGGKLPVDPEMKLQARWDRWKARNRFGGEYILTGHSGEAFNTENKAILLEHPEYLAKVDGKHVPWSASAKINTANKEAVQLYVDWTVERFRKRRAADPNAFAVSVDPSDGGGHCNSDECKAIGNGSPSDQVFYIANLAARAIRAEFPDGWVNLYGYNEHSTPPTFALEPNIYVAIIPYGFNRSGLQPDEFIRAWGKKASRIGLYDYWSIPDWSRDFPGFDFLNTPRERLRFWNANKVEGFLAESSASTGALGPGWYLSARLMWNPQIDDKPILDEWFRLSFGPAEKPMRRMIERWASGFKPTSQELAVSYRDLQEALVAAKDDAPTRARILDYGRYVHYLQLSFQMNALPNGSIERETAAKTVIGYIWRIHGSAMISAFRMYQVIERDNIKEWLKSRTETYAVVNATVKTPGPGWNGITPISDEEVAGLVEKGVAEYPRLAFEPRTFGGALEPLQKWPPITGGFAPELILQSAIQFHIIALPRTRELRFKLKCADPIRVVLLDNSGEKEIWSRTVAPGEFADNVITIPITNDQTNGTRYRVRIGIGRQRFTMQAPEGLPFTFTTWSNTQGEPTPRLYFFVPRELNKLALYLPYIDAGLPLVRNAAGTPVAPEVSTDGGHLLLFDVPAGQDGKVWSMDKVKNPPGYQLQLLNAPNAFSFAPETLMVPVSATKF